VGPEWHILFDICFLVPTNSLWWLSRSWSYQTIVPHTRISSVPHTRRNLSERVRDTKYHTPNWQWVCGIPHTLWVNGKRNAHQRDVVYAFWTELATSKWDHLLSHHRRPAYPTRKYTCIAWQVDLQCGKRYCSCRQMEPFPGRHEHEHQRVHNDEERTVWGDHTFYKWRGKEIDWWSSSTRTTWQREVKLRLIINCNCSCRAIYFNLEGFSLYVSFLTRAVHIFGGFMNPLPSPKEWTW